MIAKLSVAIEALKECFRNWRLWLIQFVGNVALFGLFTLWLLLPVANIGYILLNVLVAVLILVSMLVLHAGTLDYFSSQGREERAGLLRLFLKAGRNIPAVAVSVAVLGLLWFLAGIAGIFEDSLPNYLRSISPTFVRNIAPLSVYEDLVGAGLFTLQWILAPGLVLPLLASASSYGFRGFARPCLTSWIKCVTNLFYWAVFAVAAVLGVYVTGKIMDWTPDFRTSTLSHETASLIWRGIVSYLLALFAWMFVCSMTGRQSGTAADTSEDVIRQTTTQPI